MQATSIRPSERVGGSGPTPSSESLIVQLDGGHHRHGRHLPNMVVLARYAPSGEPVPCADGQVARVGSRFHGDGLYRADSYLAIP